MTKQSPRKGSGGQGRRALAGKGPTPKAQDRPYHKAYRPSVPKTSASLSHAELVWGRNAVTEALQTSLPVRSLKVARGIGVDAKIRSILAQAAQRGIAVAEVPRATLDQITGNAVHQGVVLDVRTFEYGDILGRAREAMAAYQRGSGANPPVIVALDGVTDPQNFGAILRSVAAFSSVGVILTQRRSVSVTAAVWKTSAGAVSRVCVGKVVNMTRALRELQGLGFFVVGLDSGVAEPLTALGSVEPRVLVVGAEGRGLSRLVAQTCDVRVTIPIDRSTESLNASVAVGISLYELTKKNTRLSQNG